MRLRPICRSRRVLALVATAGAVAVGLPLSASAAPGAAAAPSAPSAKVVHPCGVPWTIPTFQTWAVYPRGKSFVVFSKPDTHSKRIAKITDPAANGSIGVLLGVDSTVTKKVGWMQVTVPSRSNKLWGWARVRDLSGVRLRNWIEINTASHKLAVVQGTKCVRLFPVAVGTKSTPTPKGIFFINDRIKAPNAAYGHWLLSVSAYSPAFVKFGGLDAAIGIHGTNEDGSVGKSASHGCVRMHIRDSDWLYPKIPPGTPVIIS